jgi:maltose O-acetyltransferase
MYSDLTPELVQARERAVLLTARYNESFGKAPAQREDLLKQLFAKIGCRVYFEPNLRCEFGFNITIGNDFYANFDCIILDGATVEIGDNVLFGPRVGVYTSNHAVDAQERAAGACYAKPVRIGNRVWVGAGTHINPGVTVGDDAIIGSGSVVTKNVPGNVIAAGSPCRGLRALTENDRAGFTI